MASSFVWLVALSGAVVVTGFAGACSAAGGYRKREYIFGREMLEKQLELGQRSLLQNQWLDLLLHFLLHRFIGSTAASKSPAGSSAAYMAPVLLSLSGYALTLAPVPVSVPNASSAASYRTGYGTNKGTTGASTGLAGSGPTLLFWSFMPLGSPQMQISSG